MTTKTTYKIDSPAKDVMSNPVQLKKHLQGSRFCIVSAITRPQGQAAPVNDERDTESLLPSNTRPVKLRVQQEIILNAGASFPTRFLLGRFMGHVINYTNFSRIK